MAETPVSGIVRRVSGAVVALLCLLLCDATAIAGTPPQLSAPLPLSHVYAVGDTVTFQIHYSDAENDTPLEAGVQIITPSGNKIERKLESADLSRVTSDSNITVTFQPSESGEYQYHYLARDADGLTTFPDRSELLFKVQPNWLPWVISIGGVLVSLLVITSLIYQVMHRLFHASATSSARVALMVGSICAVLSVLYAWDWLTRPLAWMGGGLIILLIGIWALVSR